MTAAALPRVHEDDRLGPVLKNLSQGFVAGVPSQWSGASEVNGEDIKAEMIDEIARKHYPMCMRNLHDNLRRDPHLKHFGRLQYGLFLKVIHIYARRHLTILTAVSRSWVCLLRRRLFSGGNPSAR